MAYQKFGSTPVTTKVADYEVGVYPLLQEAYATLNKIIQASWKPEEIATMDLSWWVARRQQDMADPAQVGSQIAKLYHTIYNKPDNHHFNRAGYLRAMAGRYRDECQNAWGSADMRDWNTIKAMLEHSYHEFYLGTLLNPT